MLRFAFRNLLSRPLRSLLSLLGLTVAIAGMVGLFSVAEGLSRVVDSAFGRIPGLVALQTGAPIPLFSRLPADWINDIQAVDGVRAVTPEVWQRANVIEGRMVVAPPRFLFGLDILTTATMTHAVYRDDMVTGRFLNASDRGRHHAIVSKPIAEEFDVDVGDTLRVNGQDLAIVGIYYCGSLLLDVAIVMDIDIARSMSRFDEDSVSGFYIEPLESVDADELADRIRGAFRGRTLDPSPQTALMALPGTIGAATDLLQQFGQQLFSADQRSKDVTPNVITDKSRSTGSGPPDDLAVDDALPLEIRSAADWVARFDQFSQDLDLVLGVLTTIGLTVAVLSIINTMLMSVTERMVVFGVLKANGWSKRDVMQLVLLESALLGAAGGVFGAGVGWAGTLIVNAQFPDRMHLFASPELLLFSAAFSTIVGIGGGLYPAWSAMRRMPMDAIRRG